MVGGHQERCGEQWLLWMGVECIFKECNYLRTIPLMNKYSELPECPNYDFSLAMVNSLLTAVGGMTPRV